MDHAGNGNHWRQMFDSGRRDSAGQQPHGSAGTPPFGYDDGHDPTRQADEVQHTSLSPEQMTDEAAMALAVNEQEYRPWILQRGRGRPALMLHLRRFDTKSRLWIGWHLAYAHLIAVEYTGDDMLSLDFGSRQFVIEGSGLNELARHLQTGSVLMVQEWSDTAWRTSCDFSTPNLVKKIVSP